MPKHIRLLIALVAGAILGVLVHPVIDQPGWKFTITHIIGPIGQIFLRMIFVAVVPLIFSALVLAVVELSVHRGLRQVVRKTIFYTLVASTFSVLIGIGLVNWLKPGVGISKLNRAVTQSSGNDILTSIQQSAASAKPFSQVLVELIPKNPLEAAVRALNGEILAWMVFALIFGIALSLVAKKNTEKNLLVVLLEELYAICMHIIDFAMKIAPLGVFALVFQTISKAGHEIIGSLLFYVAVVVGGLLLQQFVVYTFLLKVVAKRSPLDFMNRCKEVFLYAFSTASSNATLPRTLAVAENELKIPKNISRFVLTIGSTLNQNGTALFEGVTVLFLAQVYGIDLDLTAQVQVVLMSILAGIGTAGVPGGSLPPIVVLIQSLGIPAESIGLILGVDRFLDMCRTTINVSGDLVIAALVSKPPRS